MKKRIILIMLLILFFNISCEKDKDYVNLDEQSDPQNYATGLLEENPEIYNQVPLATFPAMGSLPEKVELDMPPAGNQGTTQGSCTAWAVAYGLQSYHRKNEYQLSYTVGSGINNSTVCSPAYIYNQIRESSCAAGSYITSALDMLQDEGVCTMEQMPYNENSCSTLPNNDQRQWAQQNRIRSYERLYISVESVKAALNTGFPVVIGARLDNGFHHPENVSGKFIWNRQIDGNEGRHAMVVSGYDDYVGAFKVLNSWGSNWRNNGSFWIDYDIFDDVVYQAFIAYSFSTSMRITDIDLTTGNVSSQNIVNNNNNVYRACPITIHAEIESLLAEKREIELRAVLINANGTKFIIDQKTIQLNGDESTVVEFYKSQIISQSGEYSISIERVIDDNYFTVAATPIPNPFGVQIEEGECGNETQVDIFTNTEPVVTKNSAIIVTEISSTESVIKKGVCWDVKPNPNINENNFTDDGAGDGNFISLLSGLLPSTVYYLRAYLLTNSDIYYGNAITFKTLNADKLPIVSTNSITNISENTASCGGMVSSDGGASVTARGVCWAISSNPTTSNNHTTNGSGTGSFTSSLAGLTAGTTYYVRAYATNSEGTGYGEQKSFTTNQNINLPSISTGTVSGITENTASCGGTVSSDGGASVTARGVCWATSSNPTTSNSRTTNGSGTGSFTSSLAGLTAGTTYYVRAYATNSEGTSYGEQKSFTTNQNINLPSISTGTVSGITENTASCGGTVSSDGGAGVTARGVCWATSSNPTTSNNHTTNGSGTGSFSSSLAGLTAGTTYYVRAYATNSEGTSYGSQQIFTTSNETVIDIDGNIYHVVKIGNQYWFKENLKVTKTLSGTNINSTYYENDNNKLNTYGRLYSWEIANQICPAGWHLPSNTEWQTLNNALDDSNNMGGNLKEIGTIHWNSPNTGATNSTGFTGLPGGIYRQESFEPYASIGEYGMFWSSSEYDSGTAKSVYLSSSNSKLNFYLNSSKEFFMSVRCMKN